MVGLTRHLTTKKVIITAFCFVKSLHCLSFYVYLFLFFHTFSFSALSACVHAYTLDHIFLSTFILQRKARIF